MESHGQTKRVYSVTTEAKALLFDECVSLGSGTAAVWGRLFPCIEPKPWTTLANEKNQNAQRRNEHGAR